MSIVLTAILAVGLAWRQFARSRKNRPTPQGKPELKQFGDLSEDDFVRHPIWIGCHTADHDEPWYDDTDEETFRPRTGALPAQSSEGVLLVRGSVRLADGTELRGFLTPAERADDLPTIQPHVFVQGQQRSLWYGMAPPSKEQRQQFYSALGRVGDQVFPLTIAADDGLTPDTLVSRVDGFSSPGEDGIHVER